MVSVNRIVQPLFNNISTSSSKLDLQSLKKMLPECSQEVIVDKFTRFVSPEMQQARTMTRFAINDIRKPRIFDFHNATPDDYVRLTSKKIKDSYSRVTWQNPEDAKFYHILKEGKSSPSGVNVKILDETGSFIKNAVLKPQTVVFVDNFKHLATYNSLNDISHGDLISVFAKRNNPFANYIPINVPMKTAVTFSLFDVNQALRQVVNMIDGGLNVDILSLSLGDTIDSNNIDSLLGKKLIYCSKKEVEKCFSENEIINTVLEKLSAKENIRLIVSSGNSSSKEVLKELVPYNSEGTGALDELGKVASYSSSRNTMFTKHYEKGNYNLTSNCYGINITGLSGTDLAFPRPIIRQNLNSKTISKDVITPEQLTELKQLTVAKNYINSILSSNLIFPCKDYPFSFNRLCNLNNLSNSSLDDKYIHPLTQTILQSDSDGNLFPYYERSFHGTSFATPVRAAKIALNNMMKGVLN